MIDSIIKENPAFHNAVGALDEVVKCKDLDLYKHSIGVSQLAAVLAAAMGLPESKVQEVSLIARLHDVGKVAIPDRILYKKDKLDEDERATMNKHPVFGARFLVRCLGKPMEALDKFMGDIAISAQMGLGRLREFIGEENDYIYNVVCGILFHHERFDGRGYPCGLNSNDLSIVPAIISVADNYVAMREHRPYRKGYDCEFIIKTMLQDRGTLLHPQVIDKFISYLTAPPRIKLSIPGYIKVLEGGQFHILKGTVDNISMTGLGLTPHDYYDYKKVSHLDQVYVTFELEHEKIALLGEVTRIHKNRSIGVRFKNNKDKAKRNLRSFLQHRIQERMNCSNIENCSISLTGTLPPPDMRNMGHYEQELLGMRYCFACEFSQQRNSSVMNFLSQHRRQAANGADTDDGF